MSEAGFKEFFIKAQGCAPFSFQERYARELHPLVNIPTGLGKTAMVVIGWLWRRFGGSDAIRRQTPRRLVYCLPMRVLVEQTRDNALDWLEAAGLLAGTIERDPPTEGQEKRVNRGRIRAETYRFDSKAPDHVGVHVLIGGQDEEDWDVHPERDAILIGTQDMLLSRALNRGYAASRSRWPMQFGLLHTDCLWVFDEIQLMGSGLATTAQLEAFRRKLPNKNSEVAENGHGCKSVWMSATMRPDWLKTVDFKDRVDGLPLLALTDDDHKSEDVKRRWNATKPLARAQASVGDGLGALAEEFLEAHKLGTRSIVVVNTVRRACELFAAVQAALGSTDAHAKRGKRKGSAASASAAGPAKPAPNIVLLHSRFRPEDRRSRVADALAELKQGQPGTIIVTTQVIEAGVDVSATTLFTELAPWASLVQRFGRCNRRGRENEQAEVRWIDVLDVDAAPYGEDDLKEARKQLQAIERKPQEERSVGLRWLPDVPLEFEHAHVIRRKDLIDLFDTTPDLAGNDIDIDRYVREVEETDVRVFWRDYGDASKRATPNNVSGYGGGVSAAGKVQCGPRREEFCPAPIGEFKGFVKEHKGKVWRWSFLDKTWERAHEMRIAPGQVYLLHADAGGYSTERGWDAKSSGRVVPLTLEGDLAGNEEDSTDGDSPSHIGVWQTIAKHTDEVDEEIKRVIRELDVQEAAALLAAARWHDWGKAHKVFQNAVDDGQTIERKGKQITRRGRPQEHRGCRVIAKAPRTFWQHYDWLPTEGRKHFRHELASALAVLRPDVQIGDVDRDLVAYLIAAHHGKVRLSIRSLPGENRPRTANGSAPRFARGLWDGDTLPAVDLGGGVTAPDVTLSLEPMELGLCEEPPFAGQPSWTERMICLRDTVGPFRLVYLETILRAADMRASKAAEQHVANGWSSADRCGKVADNS